MNYYSTNKQAPLATLEEAVVKGLAGDKGSHLQFRIVPWSDVGFQGCGRSRHGPSVGLLHPTRGLEGG